MQCGGENMKRRKDYKQGVHERSMLKQKRGQIGIWVVLAVLVIGVVLVLVFLRLPLLPAEEGATLTPQQYLSACLEQEVRPLLEEIGQQGGYREPLGFLVYNDTKVPYLCYTAEYYKPCIVQQPNVQGMFERSLSEVMREEGERCVKQFEQEAEKRGWRVTRSASAVNVSFVPNAVNVEVKVPMSVIGEVSRTYERFELRFASQYYDLLAISTSILDFESTYGDSEITLYLRNYPDLSIRKTKLSDGSKVYQVRNVVTNEEFVFATRSLAWPPGYAT